MNQFYLIDYKGKYTIIADNLDEYDMSVGTISRENAIKEMEHRVPICIYYGIPAYVGKDKELETIMHRYVDKHRMEEL